MNPPITGTRPTLDPAVLEEIRAGLSAPEQKWLPSRLLYDALGSALFEAIGFLPEYGLTRADERILRTHAQDIAQRLSSAMVVELGSGSGRKTRWILEALTRGRGVFYLPIDISPAALTRCAVELSQVPDVRVEPIEADYLTGLATAARRRKPGSLLVLFLGSTIGNFEPAAAQDFLTNVRRTLRPGDGLLLGIDLVKPAGQILRAYDDPLGITAAFNRNILVGLNRDLDAEFDLSLFRHEARWNARERRVEMHLRAARGHTVPVPMLDLNVAFRPGETIWTESSYKYERGDIPRMGLDAGFAPAGTWVDEEWPFAETLFLAR